MHVALAAPEEAPVVLTLVEALLRELGEEGDEAGTLDHARLAAAWESQRGRAWAFLARNGGGTPCGVLTVVESFALYADGPYGIVNEMYVIPSKRSSGVGRMLLSAVRALARERGWARVDVTAPESERWSRTRRFYEREGFAFTGPKLKLRLR